MRVKRSDIHCSFRCTEELFGVMGLYCHSQFAFYAKILINKLFTLYQKVGLTHQEKIQITSLALQFSKNLTPLICVGEEFQQTKTISGWLQKN